MPALTSLFIRKDLAVTDVTIQGLADRYLAIRSALADGTYSLLDAENPAFASLEGFNPENLKKVIKENAKPLRIDKSKRLPVNDIYRSDLGELLLIDYFEKECDESDFYVVPLKNLWDRELDNLPGRGYDLLGYKFDNSTKPILLLGEAKVSAQAKNPPDVVDKSEDCIYNNHMKSKTDAKYLEQRLANYVKKVGLDHRTVLSAILLMIAQGQHELYEVVYGCCLVRDSTCCDDKDFGKMRDDETNFSPGFVHFVIYCFDKKLSEVVDLFYDKIDAA